MLRVPWAEEFCDVHLGEGFPAALHWKAPFTTQLWG